MKGVILLIIWLFQLCRCKGLLGHGQRNVQTFKHGGVEGDEIFDQGCNRPEITRFVGRCMYDGSGYRGWQDQDRRLRTVQGTMNKAFRLRFGRQNIHVTGSSRTDFGVHARGQAFHFDLPVDEATIVLNSREDFDKFAFTMNRLLPDDIRIYNISRAPIDSSGIFFHAIASARSKHYSYSFCTNEFVEPSRRRYCSHFWRPLNLNLLEESLQCFVGTHDFSAFSNKIEHNTRDFSEERKQKFSARRHVNSIVLSTTAEPGYYTIDFHLQSALYRMVRNIVGSSLLVAEGKMDLETLKSLIENHPTRANNKAKSAPPEGLSLEMVHFDNY